METVYHQEFVSHDSDEAHEWLRRTYADHDVKIWGDSKDFAFSCDLTKLDGLSFASMTHTMPTEIEVFNGLPDLAIVEHRAGASELTTLSFEDLQRDAAVRVDREAVEVDFTRPVTPAAGRHWSQTIQYVESLVNNSPLLATAPLARRELGWLVNSAVLACFPNSTLDAEAASYAGDTPQPLRRALIFIEERAGDPITLNEIAMAARLSPRGLQAAFRRHLDTTPLAHLRSIRMERAHRDLQSADPANGVSVAATAAKWGFTHLGRFAIDYRRRFGVYPSQTLRS